MSFPMRYGNPNIANRKTINGFLLGFGVCIGWPLGPIVVIVLLPLPVPGDKKFWKEAGFREVASAGGGRPVSFAKIVRR